MLAKMETPGKYELDRRIDSRINRRIDKRIDRRVQQGSIQYASKDGNVR